MILPSIVVPAVLLLSGVGPSETQRYSLPTSVKDTWVRYTNYAQGYRLSHPTDWIPRSSGVDGDESLRSFQTPDHGEVTFVVEIDSTSDDVMQALARRRDSLRNPGTNDYQFDKVRYGRRGGRDRAYIPILGDASHQEEAMIMQFGSGTIWLRYQISQVGNTAYDIIESIIPVGDSLATTVSVRPDTVRVGEPFDIEVRITNVGKDNVELEFSSTCTFALLFLGSQPMECGDLMTYLTFKPGETKCHRFRLSVSNDSMRALASQPNGCSTSLPAVKWPTVNGRIATGEYEFRAGFPAFRLQYPLGRATLLVID